MPEVGLRTEFFRQAVMRHMLALAGVGVGGGSLVYAAVLQHDDPSADVDTPTLTLRFRKGPLGWTLGTRVPLGGRAPETFLPAANDAGRAVARASGGRVYGSLGALLGMGATAHILGGPGWAPTRSPPWCPRTTRCGATRACTWRSADGATETVVLEGCGQLFPGDAPRPVVLGRVERGRTTGTVAFPGTSPTSPVRTTGPSAATAR